MAAVCQMQISLLIVFSIVLRCALAADSDTTSTETSTATATSTGTGTTTSIASTARTSSFACLGDRREQEAFDAGFGNCGTYGPGQGATSNFYRCDTDFDKTSGRSAAQICPQCLLCFDECSGNASAFDAGNGNCNTYAEELLDNWKYCLEDRDESTGLYALEVCAECRRCSPPLIKTGESTTTEDAETASTAPSRTKGETTTAKSVTPAAPEAEEISEASAARTASEVALLLLLPLLLSAAPTRPPVA